MKGWWFLCSMAGAALMLGSATAQPKVSAPNVILILADDMAPGDISSLNQGKSHTPAIDQLIGSSVWFSNAYSSSPVCAPARASLLTGLYPHKTGCVSLNLQTEPELTRIKQGIVTMADIFRANGYVTGLIGKWHNGLGKGFYPVDRGFDEFEGFYGFDIKTYNRYTLTLQTDTLQTKGKYLTEDLSTRAINFVKRHSGQPFFLHLAHSAPHRPLGAPAALVKHYQSKGFDQRTSTIYAMIEVMDKGIGDLMKELDNLGIRNNTIVIFSSDNGPDPLTGSRFNLGLKGTKYMVNEGGIHVPFLLNWPGRLQPTTFHHLIQFTDVLPSLVDMCKLNLPTPISFDGSSFWTALNNKSVNLPPFRFWQWNRGVPDYSHNAALRQGDWKLIRPFITHGEIEGESKRRPLLYNLKQDPFEREDLSEKYPRRYREMQFRLQEICKELEAKRLNK